MLRATRRNFEEAYRRHLAASRVAAEQRTSSHVMLLIYAAECGIKALLMRQRGARFWEELHAQQVCGGDSHDLAQGLKNLGVPGRLTISRRDTAPDKDGRREQVSVGQLHQACRYAIPLDESDWLQMLGQLDAIVKWLRSKLGG